MIVIKEKEKPQKHKKIEIIGDYAIGMLIEICKLAGSNPKLCDYAPDESIEIREFINSIIKKT